MGFVSRLVAPGLVRSGVGLRAAILAVLVELALLSRMLPTDGIDSAMAGLYAVLLLPSYAFLYLLPALLPGLLLTRLGWPRLGVLLFWLASAAVFVLSFLDARLYPLYGFHLNGFVLNLVLTPGGLDSLGGDTSSFLVTGAQLLLLTLLPGILLAVAAHPLASRWHGTRTRRVVLVALVLALLGERVLYGIADLGHGAEVLQVSESLPLYHKTYFRSAGLKLGLTPRERPSLNTAMASGRLHYPQHPLRVTPPATRYHIIWLVAESLRADMLDPAIMPATWAAAQHGRQFREHYSGGNGTRMGMFSLFYGLPGTYWFSFLGEQRSPALIDVLQQQQYDMQLYTAQSFTYPEFDRTIFAHVDRERLHVDDQGEGWQRDQRNVARLLQQLQQQPADRPLFLFNFFESTHARYSFPEQAVIRPDYLREFNYARMDVDSVRRDIDGIRDRYVNAAHALDQTLAPLWDYLIREQKLANTIVVFTGDHGEEFMDSGRWGHNSAFVPAQLHVPLVLWLPGEPAGSDERLSSHTDVVSTLLPRLGVQNPASDYSQGVDLFAAPNRQAVLAADWDRIGYLQSPHILTLPISTDGGFSAKVTDFRGGPLTDTAADTVLQDQQYVLQRLLRDLGRFYRAPEQMAVIH